MYLVGTTDSGFNPRARVGRDGQSIEYIERSVRFNPRARVGRDLQRLRLTGTIKRFNPRARVGRDFSGTGFDAIRTGFQSTRPRGARQPY